MATTIVNEIPAKVMLVADAADALDAAAAPVTPGSEVTADQLDRLSTNFFNKVRILEDAVFRNINHSNHLDPKKNDTERIFFNKSDIDQLFTDNPGSDGLWVYLGLHDHNIYPLGDGSYENKMMVVLVSATDKVANLKEGDIVKIAGAPLLQSEGLDNGKLCPPNNTCL